MSSILPAIRRISQTRKFSTALRSVSAPWLMLPPSISGGGGGDLAFNFLSLSSGKVSLPVIGGKEEAEFFKDEKTRFVGSSHGWLALSNHTDLFLTNPLTGHRIKLPPLPPVCEKPPSKVIVSCPPEYDRQGESVAMMIYGPTNQLATCHPGRSHEWTTIGDDDDGGERSYDDFVYSTTLKRFLCISKNHRGGQDLECCEVGNSKCKCFFFFFYYYFLQNTQTFNKIWNFITFFKIYFKFYTLFVFLTSMLKIKTQRYAYKGKYRYSYDFDFFNV